MLSGLTLLMALTEGVKRERGVDARGFWWIIIGVRE